tara:strand:+ start:9851 stop:10036 length:186 start_codon:yes stop_codon:yes gene_type:complete
MKKFAIIANCQRLPIAQALKLGFSHTEGKFAGEYVTTEEWIDNCFAMYSRVPEYVAHFMDK